MARSTRRHIRCSRLRRWRCLLLPQRHPLDVLVAVLVAMVLAACGEPGGPAPAGGSWSVQASPSPLAHGVTGYAGTEEDLLSSVSCASSAYCVAVGSWAKTGANFNHPLLLDYNAGHWGPLHASEQAGGLDSVSCPSVSSCVAVGSATFAIVQGSRVLVQSLPYTIDGRLSGVSCSSASDCWAVGYGPHAYDSFSRVDPDHLLLLHLEGSKWSYVTPPTIPRLGPYAPSSLLFAVSCSDATSCVAVGETARSSTGAQEMLVLSYDGSSWSYVQTPTPPKHDQSWLRGLSCVSPRSCIAVGSIAVMDDSASNGYVDRTLVAEYGGTSWRIARSPNPYGGSGSDDLSGATCVSAGRCIAVGATTNSSGSTSNLVLASRDGNWSQVPVPNSGGNVSLGDPYFVGCSGSPCWDNALYAVACPEPASCFSVGSISYQSDENDQSTTPVARTLVLHYSTP